MICGQSQIDDYLIIQFLKRNVIKIDSFQITGRRPISPRVTSLEQLSLAEFSGEYARPKVCEIGHKNVLGIWINLVPKVIIWTHFLVNKVQ